MEYFLVGDRFIPSLGPAFDLGKLIFKPDVNHFLDSKDFQMLVALYNNARLSYASLGRRVSLSAPAVRDRLNHLKKNGILEGFMLSIDPNVFDRDDLLLFFHGDFSRKNVLTAFAAPDVFWIAWKVDG